MHQAIQKSFRQDSALSLTQLLCRASMVYLLSCGRSEQNDSKRSLSKVSDGGSWKRTGPSFSPRGPRDSMNVFKGSFTSWSLLMWVMNLLAFTAQRNPPGVPSRHFSTVDGLIWR